MHAILIRRATLQDADAISALIERTVRISNAPDYEADALDFLITEMTPVHIAERIAQRDVFVAVAGRTRENETIEGTVTYFAGKLRGMFVAPERQRGRLGRRLVEHVESHARGLGVTELKLSSSLTARGFYRKLGYRDIEEEPNRVPTWLMGKTL